MVTTKAIFGPVPMLGPLGWSTKEAQARNFGDLVQFRPMAAKWLRAPVAARSG